VWKLDRLGRSMMEMMTIIVDLDRQGIGFRSLTQSFDTRSAIGRGVLALFAAVAEDDLERIRERTKAGMRPQKSAELSPAGRANSPRGKSGGRSV
jgi:DNA invertase Pin-like site-specific DNA recombinase